jgi:hypothetical protein
LAKASAARLLCSESQAERTASATFDAASFRCLIVCPRLRQPKQLLAAEDGEEGLGHVELQVHGRGDFLGACRAGLGVRGVHARDDAPAGVKRDVHEGGAEEEFAVQEGEGYVQRPGGSREGEIALERRSVFNQV